MPITKVKNLIPISMWATLLVALSGTLYGFLGYFGTKILNEHFTLSAMLFWRFFTAFLWMFFFAIVKREKLTAGLIANKSVALKVFLIGSLFYSVSTAFYFTAAQYAGTGLAMVIFFSYPVFVAIYAWLTKKGKANIIAVGSLITIVLGLVLLKGHGTYAVDIMGIIFSIISAVFYALYVINSKHNANRISSNLLTILICLGNASVFFTISCVTQSFVFPHTLTAWVHILALGIFATALPIQLLFEGLRYISSLKASILSVLEPVITMIVGAILLNESMSSLQLIGVIIILLGATLIQFERQH